MDIRACSTQQRSRHQSDGVEFHHEVKLLFVGVDSSPFPIHECVLHEVICRTNLISVEEQNLNREAVASLPLTSAEDP
jgi:hypothetical protein